MPWGVAAAVGAVGGALISSNAAKSAANTQANASNTALAEQQREYDINQANQQPYLDAGKAALSQYQTALNTPTTAADVMANDPGYQFGLDQGQTALDRKIAAMGGRVSGAALKATDQYATNYATTGYNSAYQRSQDRLNRLAALAGLGQTATSASAASGNASTNAITALQTSQGDASAASSLAQGNIWGNAGNQLAAIAQRYYSPTTSNTGYTVGGSSASNAADNIDAGGGWNPSDIRLKRDLVAVGTSPRGFTVYTWNWRADGTPARGVIAQEVAQRDPDAVRIGANGFLEVDYSRV